MGLFSGIGDFLFGSGSKNEQVSTLNSGQNQLLNQLLGQLNGENGGYSHNPLERAGQEDLMSILSNNPYAFQNYERPYIQQFQEETVPGLAERFSSQFGGQNSSAFRNSLLGAGSRLSENLASQRAMLRENARNQLFNMISNKQQMGLGTKAFENVQKQGTPGLIPSAIGGFASGFGGSPGGASWMSNLFGGGQSQQQSNPYQR